MDAFIPELRKVLRGTIVIFALVKGTHCTFPTLFDLQLEPLHPIKLLNFLLYVPLMLNQQAFEPVVSDSFLTSNPHCRIEHQTLPYEIHH